METLNISLLRWCLSLESDVLPAQDLLVFLSQRRIGAAHGTSVA